VCAFTRNSYVRIVSCFFVSCRRGPFRFPFSCSCGSRAFHVCFCERAGARIGSALTRSAVRPRTARTAQRQTAACVVECRTEREIGKERSRRGGQDDDSLTSLGSLGGRGHPCPTSPTFPKPSMLRTWSIDNIDFWPSQGFDDFGIGQCKQTRCHSAEILGWNSRSAHRAEVLRRSEEAGSRSNKYSVWTLGRRRHDCRCRAEGRQPPGNKLLAENDQASRRLTLSISRSIANGLRM
jgi:hypothetical protein